MTARKALSWTPKLRPGKRGGQLYCAPACGRGCTFDEYIAVKNAARALVARLGKGWHAHVWENLGWHYTVRRGPLQLSVSKYGKKPTYSCMLSDEPSGAVGGSMIWLDTRHYATPEAAVRGQLLLAQRTVNKLQRVVALAAGLNSK